jgi:transcription termination factor Rho
VSDTTENSAADSASTEEKAPRRRAPRRATTTEPLATAEAVTASATVTGSESNRSSDESEPAAAPRRGRGKKVEAEGATDAPAERSSSRKSTASSAESEASSTDGDSAGDSAGAAERPARSRSRSRSRNTNGNQNGSSADGDADADGSAGDRSNRNRQRDRRRGRGLSEEIEPEILEDDVLLPIGGILDVLENYAFVRTAGYLPGANDVYVSLGQVKKYNLRRGDAIVGSIKQPREGENFGRQKFNALVRIDSINGQSQEEAATRDDFATLVPLFPQERLRLETTSDRLTGRLIDVIAPVGKGQRGLVAGGPASGKSAVLLQIAEAVSTNNPEVHVMVVLVDARPEEVTEAERTVKGEVIASTFDRPAEDHTMVAELAVERAKRLVELGQDVVLLLDSLTALGRAYAVSSASSARGSHSGVDAAALYPAKKFFGAARNIENGGSLTVIASVVTETGSAVDSAILDEFVDNANLELRLSRTVADQRIFPAVDVTASGTRREDLLLGGDEVALTWRLRRGLAARGPRAALEYVLGKLGDTPTNVEFLMHVQRDSSLDETSGAGN